MRTRNIAIPAENKVSTKLGACQSVSFYNHSARAPSLMGLPRTSAPCRDTVFANRLFVFDE